MIPNGGTIHRPAEFPRQGTWEIHASLPLPAIRIRRLRGHLGGSEPEVGCIRGDAVFEGEQLGGKAQVRTCDVVVF